MSEAILGNFDDVDITYMNQKFKDILQFKSSLTTSETVVTKRKKKSQVEAA